MRIKITEKQEWEKIKNEGMISYITHRSLPAILVITLLSVYFIWQNPNMSNSFIINNIGSIIVIICVFTLRGNWVKKKYQSKNK